MSKPSAKKQVKQKKREKAAKKKVLARRKATRAEASKKRKLEMIEEKTRNKIEPYRKADDPDDTALKIEKNMKVLKALEEQYKKEMAEREDLNEMLEKRGV